VKLKITNKSLWPTPAVKILARWVCRQFPGLPSTYQIEVRGSQHEGRYAGRGGRYAQWTRLPRHYQRAKWPLEWKDFRFAWSTAPLINNRIELLVGILAHETCHATDGNPRKFINSISGSLDRARMENTCNLAADRVVRAFRIEWPTLRPRIVAATRKERATQKRQKERKKAIRHDPGPKLQHVLDLLKKWESKRKTCETKIKAYKRKVKYYEGRVAAVSQVKE